MTQHVVTIGTFDGVHLGHQAILAAVAERASVEGLPSIAYTFSLPPRALQPGAPGRVLLMPIPLKQRLLSHHVTTVVPARFIEVRDLSCERFSREILIGELAAHTVVVGERFRFGKARAGDVQRLRALGDEFGFHVLAVPSVVLDDRPVSSTRIRNLIAKGDVETAGRLLGRPTVLQGVVVSGDRLGRKLGFPTANLEPHPRVLLPKPGIYRAHAFHPAEQSAAVVYIGKRPTLGTDQMRCEIHLLTPPRNELVGAPMEVHLIERLRDDRLFPTIEELKAQIANDIETARSHGVRSPASFTPIDS